MRGYQKGKTVRVDGELIELRGAALKSAGEYAAVCGIQDMIMDNVRPGKYDSDTAFELAAAVREQLRRELPATVQRVVAYCEENGMYPEKNRNSQQTHHQLSQPVPLPESKRAYFMEALAGLIKEHLPFTDNGFGEHVLTIELSRGRSLEVRPTRCVKPEKLTKDGYQAEHSLSWTLFCSEEDQEIYPDTGGVIGEVVTDARDVTASTWAMDWAWRLAETWAGA